MRSVGLPSALLDDGVFPLAVQLESVQRLTLLPRCARLNRPLIKWSICFLKAGPSQVHPTGSTERSRLHQVQLSRWTASGFTESSNLLRSGVDDPYGARISRDSGMAQRGGALLGQTHSI